MPIPHSTDAPSSNRRHFGLEIRVQIRRCFEPPFFCQQISCHSLVHILPSSSSKSGPKVRWKTHLKYIFWTASNYIKLSLQSPAETRTHLGGPWSYHTMIGALPPANSHALGRVCGLVWGPMDAPSNGSSMGEIECQLLLGYFLNRPMIQILPALGPLAFFSCQLVTKILILRISEVLSRVARNKSPCWARSVSRKARRSISVTAAANAAMAFKRSQAGQTGEA